MSTYRPEKSKFGVPGSPGLAGKPSIYSRRRLLTQTLGGVAAYGLAPFIPRANAADEPGALAIAQNLSVLTGYGGNVLVRTSPAGQLMVDGGASEFTETLRDALSKLPGAGRVEKMFNSHWHLDQTGSNEVFGRAGATIVAHEKTRLRLSTDYYLPVEDRYQPARPPEAHPAESFYTGGATVFDGEQIDYGYLLEAHTDGDIYVHFRSSNVIAVGDALSPDRDPALDWFGGGWLGGRVDSIKLLLEISDADTRFVPSYGPVVDRHYVESEYEVMLLLFDRIQENVRKGMSAEDILAAGIMDDLMRPFDEPLEFLFAAHKGMWAHHNTLSHDIV
jgi:cyclase